MIDWIIKLFKKEKSESKSPVWGPPVYFSYIIKSKTLKKWGEPSYEIDIELPLYKEINIYTNKNRYFFVEEDKTKCYIITEAYEKDGKIIKQ